MEKQVNRNKNYTRKPVQGAAYISPLSSSERYLLLKMGNFAAFGVNEVQRVTGWNKRKVYNTLQSLKRKGIIINPKRNRYALQSVTERNAFAVSTSIVVPSYVSFWSALSFYGFTEQQVNAIQLVSPKQEKNFVLAGHRVEITVFRPKRFFGYVRERGFNIATKEKAIIDSLYMPEKSGGLEEVVKCMQNAWKELDKKKLIQQFLRFGNKSLCARAGYLIEKLGLNANTEKLWKNIPKCFVKLDPTLAKTHKYNKKWKIIENQGIVIK